ncbi:MarR family winged helix-turn-helix transcriptional regulator [Xenorhabdus budapestensis]|uniref:MarR family transcriptional regulator n=1 Tax=Xenorhabdus budapestensis TaxID=290110 RepID=A0A2D0J3D6_XENBU|nr:MarR family transcriptional regulator [Xenorhabdus budapestensis]PHM28721.1 regulator of plasmid mcrB operon [Xenorhabdus budapestensis]QTL38263.1 MarR family transcriptional regulator [Xenorhabdus budapestensis]
MKEMNRTPAGAALSASALNLFRVASSLLTEGNRLVANIGLTSARWQVLGTIVSAENPQPVAWLARDMGMNRQNVQRLINELEKEGLVEFVQNPHHKRAYLVVLTENGRKAFSHAMALEAPWMNRLAEGISLEDIHTMNHVLKILRSRLNEEVTEE